MNIKIIIPVLLALIISPQAAYGGNGYFNLEECAWNATHIVMVTEGEKIDGSLEVLESWLGDLRGGDLITLPELAKYNNKSMREVSRFSFLGEERDGLTSHLTCQKMVLFLKETNSTKDTEKIKWHGTSSEGWHSPNPGGFGWNNDRSITFSTIWIEDGDLFVSVKSLGHTLPVQDTQFIWITFRICSERELWDMVRKIKQVRTDYEKAISLPDLAERAEALEPLLNSGVYLAQKFVIEALGDCDEHALPALRAIFNDNSFVLFYRTEAIEALVKAGGVKAGPDLTEMLKYHLDTWSDSAPRLKTGWLAAGNLNGLYYRLILILESLKDMYYAGCRKEVAEFRNFWASWPQLAELTMILELCDAILAELDQPEAKPDRETHHNKQPATTDPQTSGKHSPYGVTVMPDKIQAADFSPRASRKQHPFPQQSETTDSLYFIFIAGGLAILLALYIMARKR